MKVNGGSNYDSLTLSLSLSLRNRHLISRVHERIDMMFAVPRTLSRPWFPFWCLGSLSTPVNQKGYTF